MLESTFTLVPGLGPSRERELWARGITCWNELPSVGAILSPKLDDRLREGVALAREHLHRKDATALAAMLPGAARWRLWPHFRERTCFLDIETEGPRLTAVGIFDAQGPKSYVEGFNLAQVREALADYALIVTFNGSTFDLPMLRTAFASIELPPVHIDLRFVWRKLGEHGGLKKIEEKLGFLRPRSVSGLGGFEAVQLFRAWEAARDHASLRKFIEYNLYDAIQLRPLLDTAYNEGVERSGLTRPLVPVFSRGEVLYDVSRVLEQFSCAESA